MNKTILLAMLASIVISAQSVHAEQTKPAGKGAQTQQAAPNIAEFDKHLAQMQENLKQMDALMEKIRQTQNPQERQQLLQQYWTAMQGAMGTMHGMWGQGGMGPGMMGGSGMTGYGMMGGRGMGPGMMGGPMMGWGQMQGYYSNLTPEQQKQRQYMTDQYMRMQQLMLDHMMQHQYWMNQSLPAPK